jgi:hypothetical protein
MESSKDLEDRVRLCVDRVVLDQNNAGQLACAAQALCDYRLTHRRLLSSEAKYAGWVAPDNEPHPGVAQIADSVEQDEGFSHWYRYHLHPQGIGRLIEASQRNNILVDT